MISDFSFLKFLGNILYPAMESYPTVPIQSTSRNSMTVQTNPLVRDVLLHNNFLDCELIESPQSSWLFTDTDSGIKQMSAFYALLNKHFFDPRMDIDRLTISTVWVDRDNMPRQANKFTVDDSSKDHLLLANAIEAENPDPGKVC